MSDKYPSPPLSRLQELSEVESPEVVRVALRRFRRRAVSWVFWVVLALAAGIALLVIPRHFATQSLPQRFADRPGAEIGERLQSGQVEVLLMDATRLDRGHVGLHLVLLTDDLLPGEELWAGPPLAESSGIETYRPGEPFREMSSRSKGSVLELWIAVPATDDRVGFDVAALYPARLGSSLPTTDCVVPVDAADFCPLYEGEGRVLANVTLELSALAIPDWIREESS